MSRDWTQEELQNASKAMKAAGHLGYEEFWSDTVLVQSQSQGL